MDKKDILLRNIPPALLFVLYLTLHQAIGIETYVFALEITTLVATFILLIIIYVLQGRYIPTLLELLSWALAFRCIFLFDAPILSDDLYRYILDGYRLSIGQNPYDLSPNAIPLQTLPEDIRDGVLRYVNHPGLVTIYPPMAQWIFSLGVRISHWPWGLKLLLVALDIILVFTIWALSPKKGPLPVAYAWHPLPVIEIAHAGHIDGAMALFAILALVLVRQEKNLLAGLFLGFSVATKLTSLVLVPFMLFKLKGPRATSWFVLGMFLGILIPSLYFGTGLLNMWETLRTYLWNWEFSGALYKALKAYWGLKTARLLLIGLLMAGLCLIPLITRGLFERLSMAFLLFLITQPTLYPWYAIPLSALLSLAWCPGCMAFLWALGLSYAVLIPYKTMGLWIEWGVATWMIFLTGLMAIGWMALSYSAYPRKPLASSISLASKNKTVRSPAVKREKKNTVGA